MKDQLWAYKFSTKYYVVDLQKGYLNNFGVHFAETFKVDINNTVDLLKGEIGSQIRDRNIIVSFLHDIETTCF